MKQRFPLARKFSLHRDRGGRGGWAAAVKVARPNTKPQYVCVLDFVCNLIA